MIKFSKSIFDICHKTLNDHAPYKQDLFEVLLINIFQKKSS